MALTATASQGFEHYRTIESNEIILVPGEASTTYNVGDLVLVGTDGRLDKATANQMPVGVVTKKVVVPAQTVAFPNAAGFGTLINGGDSDQVLTLVPIAPLCPVGSKVLKATFKDHLDDTVVTYSSGSRYIELTTGAAADDYPNGALVYVYEGKGAGQVNLVEDYDHTGGTVEKMLVIYRPFAIDLDSTSKIIVLSGEAAATRGIHQLGNAGAADENELDMNDHANDGKFLMYADWTELPALLKALQAPVVGAHLFT